MRGGPVHDITDLVVAREAAAGTRGQGGGAERADMLGGRPTWAGLPPTRVRIVERGLTPWTR